MKCQQWPCPGNTPTIGIELEYQTLPERDTTVADLMWMAGPVRSTYAPAPSIWADNPIRLTTT
eukprot:12431312-Karenia_brevis.AAC.1